MPKTIKSDDFKHDLRGHTTKEIIEYFCIYCYKESEHPMESLYKTQDDYQNMLWFSQSEVDEIKGINKDFAELVNTTYNDKLEQLKEALIDDVAEYIEVEVFRPEPVNMIELQKTIVNKIRKGFAQYGLEKDKSNLNLDSSDSLLISKSNPSKPNNIPLKDADFSLVDNTGKYLKCKLHGALLRMTADGIYRCVHPSNSGGVHVENTCKAGCQLVSSKPNIIHQLGGQALKREVLK